MRGRRVYIDTNVFIYVAVKHPDFFDKCYEVLKCLVRGEYEGYGSEYVLFELFGALARINVTAAYEAVIYYLDLPIELLGSSRSTFLLAREIAGASGVTYDAVHAAVMLENGINTIVTEDVDDWLRIKHVWNRVAKRLNLEHVDDLRVISPTRGEVH